MRKFGAILKEMRNFHGITQAQLSVALNVNQSAIANWESDNRTPDIYMLKNIAAFFSCSVDSLLDNSTNERSIIEPVQKTILLKCNELNTEGQQKLLSYADDLVKSGKYSPENENIVIGIAAKGGITATTADNSTVDAEIAKRKRRKS